MTTSVVLCLRVLHPVTVLAQPAPSVPAAPQQPGCPPSIPELQRGLSPDAWQAYQDALALCGQEDLEGAIAKMELAFKLTPHPGLLVIQAEMEWFGRRNYPEAKALVGRIDSDTSILVMPEIRTRAKALLEEMQRFVTPLAVLIDPPGAEVFIDGESRGHAPIRSGLELPLGAHSIRVVKEGYRIWTTRITVTGGGPLQVTKARLERLEGRLVIEAGLGDQILLDGRRVGRTRWEGAVASGGHTLHVTAPDSRPYQAEIVLQTGQTRRVQVRLERPPPPPQDVSTWAWIGAGATLLTAGVAVAVGIYSTRSDAYTYRATITNFPP